MNKISNDINLLRDILIILFVTIFLAAVYDNWLYIWSFGELTENVRKPEIWSAIGTVVQAIGTIIQAYIAYILYELSKKQMYISEVTLQETKQSAAAAIESVKIDRQAMTLAQRPWLKVRIDKTKGNSIRWNGTGMLANFWFSVSNVGNSPAINVTLRYKLEIKHYGSSNQTTPHVWDHERQRNFANKHISYFDPLYPSYTVFPNDTEVVYQMGGLADKQDEIIDNIMEYLRNIGAEPADRFIGFTMIGAVFYQFQPGEERYQTGIIFDLYVKNNIVFGQNVENADFGVSDFIIGRPSVT